MAVDPDPDRLTFTDGTLLTVPDMTHAGAVKSCPVRSASAMVNVLLGGVNVKSMVDEGRTEYVPLTKQDCSKVPSELMLVGDGDVPVQFMRADDNRDPSGIPASLATFPDTE